MGQCRRALPACPQRSACACPAARPAVGRAGRGSGNRRVWLPACDNRVCHPAACRALPTACRWGLSSLPSHCAAEHGPLPAARCLPAGAAQPRVRPPTCRLGPTRAIRPPRISTSAWNWRSAFTTVPPCREGASGRKKSQGRVARGGRWRVAAPAAERALGGACGVSRRCRGNVP